MTIGEGTCSRVFMVVNASLAFVDGLISVLAFWQLTRIHLRSLQLGWTRQKVFHLMIGSSNLGFFIYFVLTSIAICKGWLCWLQCCGFIFVACPQILSLATFLLLLSFWVDLFHQTDDEEDEDEESSSREILLEKLLHKQGSMVINGHRKCCPLPTIHVGSHQRVVILATLIVFMLMIASDVLMCIGLGQNFLDSSVVAAVYLSKHIQSLFLLRPPTICLICVYVDVFSILTLLLGGVLACYGLLLFLKMSRVRSERASSEMQKVAGLAIVSVLCFACSASVALFTDFPVPLGWSCHNVNDVYTSLLPILYYFIGSSIPSSFILWVMRELPPVVASHTRESRIVTFVSEHSTVKHHPQHWAAATSSQNQLSRASPI